MPLNKETKPNQLTIFIRLYTVKWFQVLLLNFTYINHWFSQGRIIGSTQYCYLTCGHSDISVIPLLILSLNGCSCFNIHWYTAPVDMMTFRWWRWSYQYIYQQHQPYSLPQVTLIYYILAYGIFLKSVFFTNLQVFSVDNISCFLPLI